MRRILRECEEGRGKEGDGRLWPFMNAEMGPRTRRVGGSYLSERNSEFAKMKKEACAGEVRPLRSRRYFGIHEEGGLVRI